MSLYGEVENFLNEHFDISNNYRIIILGGNKVYVEGHKGILLFSPEEICFSLKKSKLSIFGIDLIVKQFDNNTAIVSGKILGTKII